MFEHCRALLLIKFGGNVGIIRTRKHGEHHGQDDAGDHNLQTLGNLASAENGGTESGREFGAAIQIAVRNAQEEIIDLIGQGYRVHQAAEVVRPKFILLEPEPLDEYDREAKETAEPEKAYRERMQDHE
jgi:hypothetical protein